MNALVKAARAVLRDALDAVEVHPCDVHDDAIRARGLSDPMAALHSALAAAPAPTNEHGVDYIMAAVSSFASEWSLVGGRFDRGGMLEQAEGTRARIRAMLSTSVQAVADVAAAIHYPACWDVAAYPVLADALAAVYAGFKCSERVRPAPSCMPPEGTLHHALAEQMAHEAKQHEKGIV